MALGIPPAKPRIGLVIDKPRWALQTIAEAIARHFQGQFDFNIIPASNPPPPPDYPYDIIHVLFFALPIGFLGNTVHAKIIRSVYSFRWEQEGLDAYGLYDRYLRDAHAVTVPSRELYHTLSCITPPLFLCPEGVDTGIFTPGSIRRGTLQVGWAGNPHDSMKQFSFVEKACANLLPLNTATNIQSAYGMADFYTQNDIIICSSKREGCPRPLLEGMACGNFPVSFPVGIAPEIIENEKNGLLVEDATENGLRKALEWCKEHPELVRNARDFNRQIILSHRRWNSVLPALHDVYYRMIAL